MPTWPSPRSERLGTPKIPAIRFTRGSFFGASRFTYATACQVARPPLTDRTRSPRPQRALTSRLPAVWSPSLPLDITTTWTGLLVLAGLAPAGMAASLAAPDPAPLFFHASFGLPEPPWELAFGPLSSGSAPPRPARTAPRRDRRIGFWAGRSLASNPGLPGFRD